MLFSAYSKKMYQNYQFEEKPNDERDIYWLKEFRWTFSQFQSEI